MKDWRKNLTGSQTSILEAIKIIDDTSMQIVLVVDNYGQLLGTVTDGDIRRAILRGLDVGQSVDRIMNTNPTVVSDKDTDELILGIMKKRRLFHIPVVNVKRQITDVKFFEELVKSKRRDNIVLLMAGGLGSRLRPLTDECPKPLLKVGNKPIIETILENFIDYGFWRFLFAVNYKAEMIEAYFGDGSQWDTEIRYIREKQRLGTAGALRMLPEKLQLPLIVMNGDLLTKVNFSQLLQFHDEHRAIGTMCVREYQFQVPYGVVKLDNDKLVGMEEKPIQRFFVSAGIYVFDPGVLALMPQQKIIDMPDLFKSLINKKQPTAVFPLREYWIDIGHKGDFEKAIGEYEQYFNGGKGETTE